MPKKVYYSGGQHKPWAWGVFAGEELLRKGGEFKTKSGAERALERNLARFK